MLKTDWHLIIPRSLAFRLQELDIFQMFEGIKILHIMWFYEPFDLGLIYAVGILLCSKHLIGCFTKSLKQNYLLCLWMSWLLKVLQCLLHLLLFIAIFSSFYDALQIVLDLLIGWVATNTDIKQEINVLLLEIMFLQFQSLLSTFLLV